VFGIPQPIDIDDSFNHPPPPRVLV